MQRRRDDLPEGHCGIFTRCVENVETREDRKGRKGAKKKKKKGRGNRCAVSSRWQIYKKPCQTWAINPKGGKIGAIDRKTIFREEERIGGEEGCDNS